MKMLVFVSVIWVGSIGAMHGEHVAYTEAQHDWVKGFEDPQKAGQYIDVRDKLQKFVADDPESIEKLQSVDPDDLNDPEKLKEKGLPSLISQYLVDNPGDLDVFKTFDKDQVEALPESPRADIPIIAEPPPPYDPNQPPPPVYVEPPGYYDTQAERLLSDWQASWHDFNDPQSGWRAQGLKGEKLGTEMIIRLNELSDEELMKHDPLKVFDLFNQVLESARQAVDKKALQKTGYGSLQSIVDQIDGMLEVEGGLTDAAYDYYAEIPADDYAHQLQFSQDMCKNLKGIQVDGVPTAVAHSAIRSYVTRAVDALKAMPKDPKLDSRTALTEFAEELAQWKQVLSSLPDSMKDLLPSIEGQLTDMFIDHLKADIQSKRLSGAALDDFMGSEEFKNAFSVFSDKSQRKIQYVLDAALPFERRIEQLINQFAQNPAPTSQTEINGYMTQLKGQVDFKTVRLEELRTLATSAAVQSQPAWVRDIVRTFAIDGIRKVVDRVDIVNVLGTPTPDRAALITEFTAIRQFVGDDAATNVVDLLTALDRKMTFAENVDKTAQEKLLKSADDTLQLIKGIDDNGFNKITSQIDELEKNLADLIEYGLFDDNGAALRKKLDTLVTARVRRLIRDIPLVHFEGVDETLTRPQRSKLEQALKMFQDTSLRDKFGKKSIALEKLLNDRLSKSPELEQPDRNMFGAISGDQDAALRLDTKPIEEDLQDLKKSLSKRVQEFWQNWSWEGLKVAFRVGRPFDYLLNKDPEFNKQVRDIVAGKDAQRLLQEAVKTKFLLWRNSQYPIGTSAQYSLTPVPKTLKELRGKYADVVKRADELIEYSRLEKSLSPQVDFFASISAAMETSPLPEDKGNTEKIALLDAKKSALKKAVVDLAEARRALVDMSLQIQREDALEFLKEAVK